MVLTLCLVDTFGLPRKNPIDYRGHHKADYYHDKDYDYKVFRTETDLDDLRNASDEYNNTDDYGNVSTSERMSAGKKDLMSGLAKCFPQKFGPAASKMGIAVGAPPPDGCKCLKKESSAGNSKNFDECCKDFEKNNQGRRRRRNAEEIEKEEDEEENSETRESVVKKRRKIRDFQKMSRRQNVPANVPVNPPPPPNPQPQPAPVNPAPAPPPGNKPAPAPDSKEELINQTESFAKCINMDEVKVGSGGYRFTIEKDTAWIKYLNLHVIYIIIAIVLIIF